MRDEKGRVPKSLNHQPGKFPWSLFLRKPSFIGGLESMDTGIYWYTLL
jgi:hypothetical protein